MDNGHKDNDEKIMLETIKAAINPMQLSMFWLVDRVVKSEDPEELKGLVQETDNNATAVNKRVDSWNRWSGADSYVGHDSDLDKVPAESIIIQ